MDDDMIMLDVAGVRKTLGDPMPIRDDEENLVQLMEIPPMNDGIDRISEFPDHLLVSIISFLSISDAVRTGAVSRRWRHLWACAARLDFDRPLEAAIITNVLAQHSVAAAVHSSRIAHDDQINTMDAIAGWVQELGKLHVEKLRIEGVLPCIYPKHAFSIHSLRELELGPCCLPDAAPLAGCIGLRSFRLRQSMLSDKVLLAIVIGCPQLEMLMLWSCKGLVNPQIVSPTLTRLEMVQMRLTMVELDVPALTSLTMDAVSLKKGAMLIAPRLRSLSTYATLEGNESTDAGKKGKQARRLWTACRHSIELLEIWSGIYKKEKLSKLRIDSSLFTKLSTLSITINLNDIRQTVVLSWVLRECLHLRELNVKNERDFINKFLPASLPYTESDYWRRQEFCECLEDHLQYVSVNYFTGKLYEVEFVRFLILKASMLKRLVIRHKNLDDVNLEPLMFLLSSSLSSASRAVEVILKPEVKGWKDRNLLSNSLKRKLCSVMD